MPIAGSVVVVVQFVSCISLPRPIPIPCRRAQKLVRVPRAGNAELPTFFSQKLHFPPWFHRWPGSPSPVGLPGSAQFSRKTRQRLVSSVGTSTKKSPSQRRRQPAPRRCVRISARGLGEIPPRPPPRSDPYKNGRAMQTRGAVWPPGRRGLAASPAEKTLVRTNQPLRPSTGPFRAATRARPATAPLPPSPIPTSAIKFLACGC